MVYPTEKIRLNKLLTQAGVCSRRKADDLIKQGCVTVDGRVAEESFILVDFSQDIRVNKKRVVEKKDFLYLIVNKPKGVICSNVRQTKRDILIYDILPYKRKKLFTVGRLDKDTTGLIIVTDDGEFANAIIHPRSNIEKEYILSSKQMITDDMIAILRKAHYQNGTKVVAKKVIRLTRFKISITVTQGKKRMIRAMAKKAQIKIKLLSRIRIGNIKIGSLPKASFRHLSKREKEIILQKK